MKTIIKNSLLTLPLFFSVNGFSQIYMDQLYGFTYVRVVDAKTKQTISLNFFTEENAEENGVAGVKGHTIWDEEMQDSRSFEGDGTARSYLIEQHETCGNCLTLVYGEGDDADREYFKQEHDMGDFWLQQCTLNSKGEFVPTDKKFVKEVVSEVNTNEEATESGDEGTGQDASLERLVIYSNLPDDYNESQVELFTMYEVSSVYEGDETEDTFEMEKASDGDLGTAWFSGESEDNENYPIGEFITFTGMVYNESIFILNGYQLDEVSFKENARVQTMDLYINDQLIGEIVLIDKMGEQQIVVPNIGDFMNGEAIAIKFVITSVYKGTEYSDVGISEIFTVKR